MLYNLDKDKSLKLSCGLTTVANRVSVERYPVLIFMRGVIMLKANYKSFKDLFKATYDMVYSEEKDEFSGKDAMVLTLFSIALDSLCGQFDKEIDKERERRINIYDWYY